MGAGGGSLLYSALSGGVHGADSTAAVAEVQRLADEAARLVANLQRYKTAGTSKLVETATTQEIDENAAAEVQMGRQDTTPVADFLITRASLSAVRQTDAPEFNDEVPLDSASTVIDQDD